MNLMYVLATPAMLVGFMALGSSFMFLYKGNISSALGMFSLATLSLFCFALCIKGFAEWLAAATSRAMSRLGAEFQELGAITGQFFAWLGKRLQSWFRVASPHVAHAAASTTQSGVNLAKRGASKFIAAPTFWLATIFSLITAALFAMAILKRDWDYFHAGLVSSVLAMYFTVACNDWEDSVLNFCMKQWRGLWLTTSLAGFALVFGHGWGATGLWIFGLSSFFAAVTVAKGWRSLGSAAGSGFDRLWGAMSGSYGADLALFTIAVVAVAVAFIAPQVGYLDEGLTLLGLASSIPMILLGIGAFIVSALLFVKNRLVK